jgi:hypothetical protein
MRHHPSLKTFFMSIVVIGGLTAGLVVLPASTASQGNPNGDPPGLPSGQPFQLLQNEINDLLNQINALNAQVAALQAAASAPALVWINHLALVSGDTTDLTTSFRSTSSGVGGGLAGLVIQSATTGSTFPDGGNKVVWRALEAPPRFLIKGVRVCYELTSSSSFITQIRLAQVQDPPSTALVLLDDGTPLTNVGPVCVDSAPTSVDPSLGSVLLDLRVDIGNPADKIVVRALGLHLEPAP